MLTVGPGTEDLMVVDKAGNKHAVTQAYLRSMAFQERERCTEVLHSMCEAETNPTVREALTQAMGAIRNLPNRREFD